jgi:hypothetical protein
MYNLLESKPNLFTISVGDQIPKGIVAILKIDLDTATVVT